MEWIITVDTETFDIDQAFKIGQYIDYYQVANFRVNDTVYIIVNEEGLKPHLKYVCKVMEANIEFDDEKYFSAYDHSNSEVMISECLSRLQLNGTVPDDHKDEFELSQLDLNFIPKKPMKNIGDNKDIFVLITEKLKLFLNTGFLETTSSNDDENESKYYHQRNMFLEKFPINQWEDMTFEHFYSYQSLFLNEFNQHLNQDEVFIVKKSSINYFTAKGRINNQNTFIEHYRTNMRNAFADSKANPIFELYKQHFFAATHYYLDSPFLYEHEVKSLCNLYDLSFKRFKDAIVDVTKKIIELNPEVKDMSSYHLTKWIIKKFNFIREDKSYEQEILKLSDHRYISEDDFKKIINFIERDKYVIVNGLINFGGMQHLKELLIKHGYVEYDSQDVPYYNYLKFINSPSNLDYRSVTDKEKENLRTIVMFDHHRTQVAPFSFQLAIPFYVEYTPITLLELSDFSHVTNHLSQSLVQEVFDLFNKINVVIKNNNENPLFINKFTTQNLKLNNREELVDYLNYRIIPIIKMNQLERDIENYCIELVNDLFKVNFKFM